MAFDFYSIYLQHSDEQLLDILQHPDQYQTDALEAARNILGERGVPLTQPIAETAPAPYNDLPHEDLSTLLSPEYLSAKNNIRSLYQALTTIKGNRALTLLKIVAVICILSYLKSAGSILLFSNIISLFTTHLYLATITACSLLAPLILYYYLNRLSTTAWVLLLIGFIFNCVQELLVLLQTGMMGYSGDTGSAMYLQWLWLGVQVFCLYTLTLPYNRDLFRATRRTMNLTLIITTLLTILLYLVGYYSYLDYISDI